MKFSNCERKVIRRDVDKIHLQNKLKCDFYQQNDYSKFTLVDSETSFVAENDNGKSRLSNKRLGT